jgi:hypothetical protein
MGAQDFIQDVTEVSWLKKPPPTFISPSSLQMYKEVTSATNREPTGYLSRYAKILEVLERVKPDLMTGDMMYRGLCADACRNAGVDWVVLSPGPTLDFCGLMQPRARGLWYYPAYVSVLHVPSIIAFTSLVQNHVQHALSGPIVLDPSKHRPDHVFRFASLYLTVRKEAQRGA